MSQVKTRRPLVMALVLMLLGSMVVGLGPLGGVRAQDATPDGAGDVVIPIDEDVASVSQAEWSARHWQWFLSFPFEMNPAADPTGAWCGLGQSGPVFFLAGTVGPDITERTCVVPTDTYLSIGIAGAECSTVEPPPFFGRDEEELTECAEAATDAIDTEGMEVTVDGESIGDVSEFRVVTPMFMLTLPEDNLFGTPPGVAYSVGDDYRVILNPLPEGEHTIVLQGGEIPGFGTPPPFTYHLIVQSPQVVEPADASPMASPEA